MNSDIKGNQQGVDAEDKKGDINYCHWIKLYDTIHDEFREELKSRLALWNFHPKISVLMPVLGPSSEYLNDAICSVRNQIYQNWELCLAADAVLNRKVLEELQRHLLEESRIRLVQGEWHECHADITNGALELATGDYCAFLGHEDLLSEHALFYVTETILKVPEAGLIYSDEDKLDMLGRRSAPHFKSDWNLDLFRSQNMISDLAVYRTALLREVDGFRKGFEGSEGYDLALRAVERLKAEQIVHIPRILYHRRAGCQRGVSTGDAKAGAPQAGVRALDEHLSRSGIRGHAESLPEPETYRVRYEVPTPEPLVSLIIPTRNREDLVKKCVESICQKTEYKNYEIIIIDNGSDDPKAVAYFEELKRNPVIRVLRDEGDFNYSRLNNTAAKAARGEIIGLLNNDIEIISPGWLGEMVSLALQPGVGVVGARLWYPNDTLQHGGVITGLHGNIAHAHRGLPRGMNGYKGRAGLTQSLTAVTGACLLVRKSIYEEVRGLNEETLKEGFNDIDFCLKVKEVGYRNVWTPHADLYHHESVSRGLDETPEKQLRAEKETSYLRDTWRSVIWEDPAYNPNLDYFSDDFSLAWPPRNLDARSKEVGVLNIEDGAVFSLENNLPDFFRHFLGKGWTLLEKGGVWSVGEDAEIDLEFATKGKKRIYFDLEAFLPREDFSRRIVLTANDTHLGEVIFTKHTRRQKCYFNLSESIGQSVSLKIHIENLISPLEAKISKDYRKLGISLFGFGLEHTGDKLGINNKLFISTDSFIFPGRLIAPAPGLAHLPFAQWLVSLCNPSLFVDLGVHTGTVYCGICETIKRNHIACRAYGIDTFKKDGESCDQGNNIFAELSEYHGGRYAGFSNLFRTTADQAVGDFFDKSIDLVQINKWYTYEEVKKDFLQWLPKMSDSGIMMFHNTNFTEGGSDVWKFWREIKTSYPTFEFHHGYGFGILLIGTCQPEALFVLCEAGDTETTDIKNAYAMLSHALNDRLATGIEIKQLSDLLREKEICIEEQIREKKQLEERIRSLKSSLSWKMTYPFRKIQQLLQGR